MDKPGLIVIGKLIQQIQFQKFLNRFKNVPLHMQLLLLLLNSPEKA